MKTTINLHGTMADTFGETHTLDVPSIAHAIRAIDYIKNGFRQFIMDGSFVVKFNGKTMDEREATSPINEEGVIDIYPAVYGEKDGGDTALLGVVLVAVGFFVTPFAPTIGPLIMNAGIGLVLGGVAQMLSEVEESSTTESVRFGSLTNINEEGVAVPLVYGLTRTGSVVVSLGVTQERLNPENIGAA